MKAWILAILCLSSSLGSLAEQCGRQAGGVLCPGGLCCSEWGFCGTSNAYCGEGCQSQCSGATRPDPAVLGGGVASLRSEQCGRQAGGALCPGGLCCSEWGFCGTTNAYCGSGCQSQCGGATRPDPAVLGRGVASLRSEQCGRQAGGALCPGGLCCSEWGFCGTTNAYCGSGCQSQCGGATRPDPAVLGGGVASLRSEQCGRQAGGALCPGGLCCSEWGFCGTTNAYCGSGCQSQCGGATRPDPAVLGGGVASLRSEQCGRQAGGALCPGGLCCSEWGFCGTTNAYCGSGCQSQCGGANVASLPNEQCGRQAGGVLCPGGLCCSEWGFCGTTNAYCGSGCQSQCGGATRPDPPMAGGGVASLLNETLFEEFLQHRNNAACPARDFYTYDAFVTAADSFSGFATTGDMDTRKREIAAFFGQTSHETTGGWPDAPGGPYAWGYCFLEEVGATADYCVPSTQWPCAPDKKYFGRGPIQISYNYNYGPAGEAIGVDLLNNPELVAKDPIIAFKTALWFWMTPQSPKPSCHDVITEQWTPSTADINANRLPGYGVITNIINGGLECGHGPDNRVLSRIGFYKRYCDILGVSYGENLDCYNQGSFGIFVDVMK